MEEVKQKKKYNYTKKPGQPTKYKKEYCQMLIDFFSIPPTRTAYKKEYNRDGSVKAEIPFEVANPIPQFQKFADLIGVDTDTLLNWKDTYIEFFGAYTRAKQLQEAITIQNGLSGQYNPQLVQFLLKNCHKDGNNGQGYQDKIEIDGTNQQILDPAATSLLEKLSARLDRLELPEATIEAEYTIQEDTE